MKIWKARQSASACSPTGDTGGNEELKLVTAPTPPPEDVNTTSAMTLAMAFSLSRGEQAPLFPW